MYFLMMSSVTLSPTLRTLYPSSHNSPPHSERLISGNSLTSPAMLCPSTLPLSPPGNTWAERSKTHAHGHRPPPPGLSRTRNALLFLSKSYICTLFAASPPTASCDTLAPTQSGTTNRIGHEPHFSIPPCHHYTCSRGRIPLKSPKRISLNDPRHEWRDLQFSNQT